MRTILISLAVATALAALLVGARVMLTPGTDAATTTVERSQPPPAAEKAPASISVAALEPAPEVMAAAPSAPLSRREAEARLEQIESQLDAMEAEFEGLDDLSEADAEALFQRIEPLLEQLGEAELALEAAIEAEGGPP